MVYMQQYMLLYCGEKTKPFTERANQVDEAKKEIQKYLLGQTDGQRLLTQSGDLNLICRVHEVEG